MEASYKAGNKRDGATSLWNLFKNCSNKVGRRLKGYSIEKFAFLSILRRGVGCANYAYKARQKVKIIYSGTMRVIVYIYIVSIVLLLLYTGVVYFLTEKYQPRETDESSKGFKINQI